MTEQTQENNGQFDEIYADLNPKRNPYESFEEYKQRRAKHNKATKDYLKGQIFFNPNPVFLGTTEENKEIWSSPKTYRKEPKHV